MAKANYHNGIFSATNPRLLWGRIHELLGGKSRKNAELTIQQHGRSFVEPVEVANVLNEHFTSVAVNLASTLRSDGDINKFNTIRPSNTSIFLRPATPLEICNIISVLNAKKACGYDGFPVAALKMHRLKLSTILCDCFNDCISEGVYPDCLKAAIVTPIFKNGDRKDPSNYRPISVLPSINKVFEKLLANRLVNFLSTTNQLYQHQFGFRQGSSTEVAVLELVDELAMTLDRGDSAGTVFLDLSKAFDTINHKMLLKKLNACGIRGLPNCLFQSYLEGRTQQVVVSGVRGESKIVSAGVPQGSNLGPLLFLIFVNDFANLQLRGKPRLFADDTALSYSNRTPTLVIEEMGNDMELILKYLENNLLALNISKSKMMIFRFQTTALPSYPTLIVNGQTIEETSNFKYLGVHLDNRLCWDVHVREVISSCAPLCGMLRKLAKTVPRHVLLKLYYAFIHSRYQYAITAWGNAHKTVIKDIQVQQNRCIKAIYHLPYLHPTRELYTMQHNILPIFGIFTQKISITMFKTLNNRNLHHNWRFTTAQHHHNTRHASRIQRSRFRTELGRRRFLVCGPNTYNNLPENIKQSTTVSNLKRLLGAHIRSNINNFLLR